MYSCCGIDLTGDAGFVLHCEVDGDSVRPSEPGQRVPFADGHTGGDFQSLFDRKLVLSPESIRNGARGVAHAIKETISLKTQALFSRDTAHHDRIGFCFPYRTPPIVRRAIPKLVKFGPDWIDRSTLSQLQKFAIIEAPLAVSLDWYVGAVTRSSSPPGPMSVAVLSGCQQTHELSVVEVDYAGGEEITMRVVCSIAAESEEQSLAELRVQMSRIVERIDGQIHGFVVSSEDLQGLARKIAAAAGSLFACDPIVDPRSPARGAARFAAAWGTDQRLHGTTASGFRVDHLVTRPLGLAGTYRGNLACWRRLVSPGPLTHDSVVAVDILNSTRMVLAELNSMNPDRLWVGQSEQEEKISGSKLTLYDVFDASAWPDNSEWVLQNQTGTRAIGLTELQVT